MTAVGTCMVCLDFIISKKKKINFGGRNECKYRQDSAEHRPGSSGRCCEDQGVGMRVRSDISPISSSQWFWDSASH